MIFIKVVSIYSISLPLLFTLSVINFIHPLDSRYKSAGLPYLLQLLRTSHLHFYHLVSYNPKWQLQNLRVYGLCSRL